MTTSLYFLLLIFGLTFCAEHPIYWKATDSIWSTDEPTITVHIGDRLRLFCPDQSVDEDERFLKVYQVGELSHVSCMLDYDKKAVMVCDPSNNKPSSIVVNVRTATAMPNGLTFQPETTYYWITTSTGSKDGLDRTRDGMCRSTNMRLKIEVVNSTSPSTHEGKGVGAGRIPTRLSPHYLRKPQPPPVAEVELTDSQLRAAQAAPGVDPAHLKTVLAYAREGMTGKYVREQPIEDEEELPLTAKSPSSPSTTSGESQVIKGEPMKEPQPWEPASMDIYKGIYNDNEISPQNIFFEVHEGVSYSRSDSLASSTLRLSSLLLLLVLPALY